MVILFLSSFTFLAFVGCLKR